MCERGLEEPHGDQQRTLIPHKPEGTRGADGQTWGRELVLQASGRGRSLPTAACWCLLRPSSKTVVTRGSLGLRAGAGCELGQRKPSQDTSPRQQRLSESSPGAAASPCSWSRVAPKPTQTPQAGAWEVCGAPLSPSPRMQSATCQALPHALDCISASR